jgi:hypothetical protein
MSRPRKIDLVLRGKNLNGDAIFLSPAIRKQWATHFDNLEWICTFKLISSLNEKQRMFAYLFGPLLDSALVAYEKAGYEFANTDDLYYHFKKMFARYAWYNPVKKKEEARLYDYSDDTVPADLLNKFINDVILHLEQEFEFSPPDAASYKAQMRFGSGFKAIKGTKFTDV